MELPPEAAIRATIKSGSVFYFPDQTLTSSQPHYFVVINIDPLADSAVLLVCASSQIGKVKHRRRKLPQKTLIEITTTEYSDFTVDSIIDCNNVWEKTIAELIQKRSTRELELKARMNDDLITKLRLGVLASPMVEHHIKALVKP